MNAIAIGRSDPMRSALPLLRVGEEQALCRRWHDHHDVAAAGRLMGNHLHLVVGAAMAHRDCGLPTQELIGEGYIGLMHAACRYNPSCGVRFSTYATWWVQATIRQSILCALPSERPDLDAAQAATAVPPLDAHRSGQRSLVQIASSNSAE